MAEAWIDQLKKRLRQFAAERDWQKYHSPKNLSMALIAEAAELVEHFQWLTEEQSANLPPEKLAEVELELADIQIYLVELGGQTESGPEGRSREKAGYQCREIPCGQGAGEFEEIFGIKWGFESPLTANRVM